MKISIITVTYNAASVLKRTLDSVKAQSWQQIEHLIIDGASKDETVSMAETYKAQCPYEVVILSEPDKGLYDAMNKGLRLATGDYLVFLNAGDTLHAADTLETIVRSAQPLPGVLYGDTAITDEQGKFLHLRRLRPQETLVEVVPSGNARMSSGFLRLDRYCKESSLRPALPLFCRC